MRILCVLCAVLAIAVTSLARPKNAEDANDKTTTALPLVTATKNNSSNNAPVESSNEKLASTVAYTTPIVTTADKPKDHVKSDINLGKASDVVNETTTVIAPTTKVSLTTKPATSTTTTVATTVVHTTNAVSTKSTSYPDTTTALPPPTACPPQSDRHFDGLSFLGGIILTVCLIGVGVILCKYCQSIHEDKYRTL